MAAKILAILGALGLIATIWTGDLRYLWTGILLLVISVGIAANADKRRKEAEARRPAPLPPGLSTVINRTGREERIIREQDLGDDR